MSVWQIKNDKTYGNREEERVCKGLSVKLIGMILTFSIGVKFILEIAIAGFLLPVFRVIITVEVGEMNFI